MSDFDPVAEFERKFPEVSAGINAIVAECQAAILASPTAAKDEREQMYFAMKAAERLRKKLIEHINAQNIKKITEDHAATLAYNGRATA